MISCLVLLFRAGLLQVMLNLENTELAKKHTTVSMETLFANFDFYDIIYFNLVSTFSLLSGHHCQNFAFVIFDPSYF